MAQDEQNQPAQQVTAAEPLDLEALIAVVEQRIVENLARLIEQMVERSHS